MKEKVIMKLTSRKLWISIAGFVSMLMIYKGATQDSAAEIAAIIMAGATVVTYVLGEGFIDSESAKAQNEEDNKDE